MFDDIFKMMSRGGQFESDGKTYIKIEDFDWMSGDKNNHVKVTAALLSDDSFKNILALLKWLINMEKICPIHPVVKF